MSFHAWLGLAVGLPTAALLVLGLVGWATGRWDRHAADRVLLVALLLCSVAVAGGLITALVGGPPADPLHLVYGAAALAVLPIARYLGRVGDPRRRAGWLGLGSLVLLALLVRLVQTG
jgi:hypothetical protein